MNIVSFTAQVTKTARYVCILQLFPLAPHSELITMEEMFVILQSLVSLEVNESVHTYTTSS